MLSYWKFLLVQVYEKQLKYLKSVDLCQELQAKPKSAIIWDTMHLLHITLLPYVRLSKLVSVSEQQQIW